MTGREDSQVLWVHVLVERLTLQVLQGVTNRLARPASQLSSGLSSIQQTLRWV